MIEIANLEEWTKEYFSDPENQKKAENAASGIGHFFFFLSNLNPQLVRMGILQNVMAFHGIKF